MGVLILILVIIALCKFTGFLFCIFGKLLGGILGIAAYIVLGALAVAGLGLTIAFFPITIVVGILVIIGINQRSHQR